MKYLQSEDLRMHLAKLGTLPNLTEKENTTTAFKYSLLLEKFGTELQFCDNWMFFEHWMCYELTITGQLELKHAEQVLSHCNCDKHKLDVYIVDHRGRANGVQRIVQCPNLSVLCDSSSTPAQISRKAKIAYINQLREDVLDT